MNRHNNNRFQSQNQELQTNSSESNQALTGDQILRELLCQYKTINKTMQIVHESFEELKERMNEVVAQQQECMDQVNILKEEMRCSVASTNSSSEVVLRIENDKLSSSTFRLQKQADFKRIILNEVMKFNFSIDRI